MSSLRNVAAAVLATATVAVACTGLDSSGLSDDDPLGEPDSAVPVTDSAVDLPDTPADTEGDLDADSNGLADADAGADVTVADGSDARDATDASDSIDGGDGGDARDAADTRDAAEDVRDAQDAGPPFCDRADLDLLGCYRFESGEHAIQPWDDSSYDHHGTTIGATFVPGKVGQGASTKAGSLLLVPERTSFVLTNKLSVEAWVFLRTVPAAGRVGVVDHNGRYGLFIFPGGVVRSTAPGLLDTPAVITAGAWFHVATTYDGTTQIVYVNGFARAAAMATATFGPGDGQGLAFGSNSPSGDELDGIIDSVRIYRVARTALQICKAAGTC